jgi:hypothetical protein
MSFNSKAVLYNMWLFNTQCIINRVNILWKIEMDPDCEFLYPTEKENNSKNQATNRPQIRNLLYEVQ